MISADRSALVTGMRLKLSELRRVIDEAWYSSVHGENNLLDDESHREESVLVPDDIKDSIEKWALAMGLKKRRRTQK